MIACSFSLPTHKFMTLFPHQPTFTTLFLYSNPTQSSLTFHLATATLIPQQTQTRFQRSQLFTKFICVHHILYHKILHHEPVVHAQQNLAITGT